MLKGPTRIFNASYLEELVTEKERSHEKCHARYLRRGYHYAMSKVMTYSLCRKIHKLLRVCFSSCYKKFNNLILYMHTKRLALKVTVVFFNIDLIFLHLVLRLFRNSHIRLYKFMILYPF